MHNDLNRRHVMGGMAAGAAYLALPGCSEGIATGAGPGSGKPNIVFILADDLGYADVSCYGRRDYETPHIDSLARDGIRYTHAYANSAVCSATRTGLITGRYQYRLPVGLEEPLGFNPGIGLDPSLPNLPSLLKEQGYQTALVGKWHLGSLPNFGPLKSGYDHFYGIHGGGVDYFTHEAMGKNDLWDGDTNVEEVGHLTDLIGQRAVEQIESFAEDEEPFFLSLHFTSPHWPWQAPDEEGKVESARLDKVETIGSLLHYDGGDLETYAEMVRHMDEQVGRVVEALKSRGLEDNTIIVFTSDNGGERFSDTWPFTGMKGELLEGGTRVPGIVKWPAGIEAGQENDSPIMSMDFLPTFLALNDAGSDLAFDGVDISATFAGGVLAERPLYWRFNIHDQKSIRRGKWKYLQIGENEFLFDVIADPLERGNLKSRFPDVFEELKAQYETWNATMLAYSPQNFSAGHTGATVPDRYGATKASTIGSF